ncbi:methionine--tRNA ligase subunit beta [Thermococcus sp.]|uniref:methionine--tRNA ligase subunit beta n=1 Tax=Thermococcus sp. TaxID=35749 RepID=UPI00262D2199|nr:methionine--tRNA ligase subunit beta [Thermococcus sp.]
MELYDVDEFWRFDLRVGLVKKAERLKRTRKLIKLEVDFGSEERTIISGIADRYSPEDLEGKKFVFVFNLKPKKLSGVESRGMLIVAETEDGKVYLLPVPDEVPVGTKVW